MVNFLLKSFLIVYLFFISFIILMSYDTAYSNLDDSKHSFADHNIGQQKSNCMFCHIPHNAERSVPGAPLWATALPHDYQFILYGNGSTSNETTIDRVGVNSKTCLSCHDETIGTSIGDMIDLRGTHPIGFKVNPNVANLGSLNEMIARGAKFFGPDENRMECGSCHDPHETSPDKYPFLRFKNTTICIDCHSKM